MSEHGPRSEAGSAGLPQPPDAHNLPDMMTGFTGVLGLEPIEVTGSRFVGRWPITPALLQPFGILHGGAITAVVESAASVAGYLAVADAGGVVAGVNNNTDFYRAVRDGMVLDVVAEPVFQGRSQQVWQVDFRDDRGRLTARGTLRLHNMYPPKP